MRRRMPLLLLLLLAVIFPAAASNVDAAAKNQLEELAAQAIVGLPLEAGDIIAAIGLECSPVKGLVDVKLNLTPIDLQKKPLKIEFTNLTTIRATASFLFKGHYELLVNKKIMRANDFELIGEGGINISFQGFKLKIDDIPFLVMKLANRADVCPDIDKITRQPKNVAPGGTYQVATTVTAKDAGHIAYFIYANNKAAQNPEATLRTVLLKKKVDYSTPITVRSDMAPGDYFGNVMAVDIVNNTKNPLDLKSYDVLFSTGITMIAVKKR